MRPPDLPGGNHHSLQSSLSGIYSGFNEAAGFIRRKPAESVSNSPRGLPCFNEAAGFTRRKPHTRHRLDESRAASMRPPDLPGGNHPVDLVRDRLVLHCFNEAAGFTRRKRP